MVPHVVRVTYTRTTTSAGGRRQGRQTRPNRDAPERSIPSQALCLCRPVDPPSALLAGDGPGGLESGGRGREGLYPVHQRGERATQSAYKRDRSWTATLNSWTSARRLASIRKRYPHPYPPADRQVVVGTAGTSNAVLLSTRRRSACCVHTVSTATRKPRLSVRRWRRPAACSRLQLITQPG